MLKFLIYWPIFIVLQSVLSGFEWAASRVGSDASTVVAAAVTLLLVAGASSATPRLGQTDATQDLVILGVVMVSFSFILNPAMITLLTSSAASEEFAFRVAPLALVLGRGVNRTVILTALTLSSGIFTLSHAMGGTDITVDRFVIGFFLGILVLFRMAIMAIALHVAANAMAILSPTSYLMVDFLICCSCVLLIVSRHRDPSDAMLPARTAGGSRPPQMTPLEAPRHLR